jgi:hypothetical protein
MLRRTHIVTVAALAACALPASAAMAQKDYSQNSVTGDYAHGPPPPAQAGSHGSLPPDARDAIEKRGLYAVDRPEQVPTVTVRELPASNFDWGDAGIGAAGMLALLSIAAGSTLLLAGWRRRRGFQVVSH